MEPQVIDEPFTVESYLRSLGVDREGLVQAVRFAESESALCTMNDPIGFAQMTSYARAGRMLREVYVKSDSEWERDNSYNQCAIRNIPNKIRIVPCNFDEGAGDRLVTPSNRSPKGEISRRKSMCNRTAWLPGIVEAGSPIDEDGFRTWVLGFCIDENRSIRSEVRAELSMPVEFDGRYFTKFGTRIILLDGKGPESTARSVVPDSFAVVDIPVVRRSNA